MKKRTSIIILSSLFLCLPGCGKTSASPDEVKPSEKTGLTSQKEESLPSKPEEEAPSDQDNTEDVQTPEKTENENTEETEIPSEEETVQTPAPAAETPEASIQPKTSEDPVPASDIVIDYSGGPDTVRGIAIVNKKHGLGSGYAPGENPAAKNALVQLQSDMQNLGYDISWDYSGYRSYEYQSLLYNSYASRDGTAQADRYSARPGYSEHQTGLAFDLKHSSGELVTKQPEAQWLMDHAHEYGFIVRYLPGTEAVTGYMEEPWHLRYIGDQAAAVKQSGLTLEEYLGVEGGGYQ